jgi:hypothetical protein
MVKNGVCSYDICKEEIPKGARYRVNTILKNGPLPDPSEKETSFDLDSEGNIRRDVCLDCWMHVTSPE